MHTEKKKNQQLLFVYNARSGTKNAIWDSLHKVFSPSTYDCNLCDITYGLMAENRLWKRFRERSNMAMSFLHKDEFQNRYPNKFVKSVTFPIVLVENGNGLETFISTTELNALNSAKELIGLIQERKDKMSL